MHKRVYILGLFLLCGVAFATTCAQILPPGSNNVDTIGKFLCNIKQTSFQGIYKLIFVVSYVSGFAVIGNAIFKLKQVKDNPTQIPVSTPIALFVCGTLLMMLPSVIVPAGETLFGSSTDTAYTVTPGGTSGSPGAISDSAYASIPQNLLDR